MSPTKLCSMEKNSLGIFRSHFFCSVINSQMRSPLKSRKIKMKFYEINGASTYINKHILRRLGAIDVLATCCIDSILLKHIGVFVSDLQDKDIDI